MHQPVIDRIDTRTRLHAEWHGRTLIVPDDDLRNTLLRRTALSVSTAQTITGCPAQFALDRLYTHTGEQPPDDLLAPNSLGSMAHEVLEKLYALPPEQRSTTLADTIAADVVHTHLTLHGLTRQKTFAATLLDEVRTAYKGLWRYENPEHVTIAVVPTPDVNGNMQPTLGLELSLAGVHVAGGVPLSGFIDRATAINGDPDRIGIADYKSGARPKKATDRYFRYGDQLRIYTMGFEQLTGIVPEAAGVIYIRQTRSKILSAQVPLDPKDMAGTAAWFHGTYQDHLGMADSGEYPTKDNTLCGWCPFIHVCPSAAGNGREPKIDQPDCIAPIPTHTPVHAVSALNISSTDISVDADNSISTGNIINSDSSVTVEWEPEHATMTHTEPSESTEQLDSGYMPDSEYTPDSTDWSQDRPEPPAPLIDDTTGTGNDTGPRTISEHISETQESKENHVSKLFGRELKPWETGYNGELPNPNGYDAIGAFGIAALAVEEIHKAGITLTPTRVTSLSETFATIIRTIQDDIAGTTDLGSGANTRLRGALRTALDTLPVPFGGSITELDEWADDLARRTRSIAYVAVHVLQGTYADKPWRVLTDAA